MSRFPLWLSPPEDGLFTPKHVIEYKLQNGTTYCSCKVIRDHVLVIHYERYNQNVYMIYLLTAVGWHPVAVVQYTFTHKQYTEQHN